MKISIITINYNNIKGLELTIPSVLMQDYPDWEYIVIDGGSTDGSVDLIKKNAGKIHYWVSEKDAGIYNAMNKGIKAATGEFIVMINSGDALYAKDTLSLLASGDTDADVIYGNLMNVDTKTGQETLETSKENMTFKWWYLGYSIPHAGTMIRKSALDKLGLYDERLKIVADWKFYLRAFFYERMRFLKKDVITARFALEGISSNIKTSHLIYEEREKVMREDFPYFFPDYDEIYSGGTRRAGYLITIQKYPFARKLATVVLQILSKLKF